jgi:hypothetical protein
VVFGILVGASQAWLTQNNMPADGISYLDMGSAFANGHAGALINGYWSPLYPAVIGAALAIVRPSPQSEFALLHAVNFIIFLLAFASFEFFLRAVVNAGIDRDGAPPAWFLQLTGYIIFLWATLGLITVSVASPDMLMAVFVFLATGLLVRIASTTQRGTLFLGLGLVLGLGYLTKAPMFPLAFVYLAIAAALAGRSGMLMRGIALVTLALVVVSVPYIWLLSKDKRRLTFGDSGRLNYAWYVDGATYRHWQGEALGLHSEVAPDWTSDPIATGLPVHPTRKVLRTPPIFAFDGSTGGTYPVWYDPSYWNEGLRAPFDLTQQLRKIVSNAKSYYATLANPHVVQLYREGHAFQFFSPLLLLCFAALVALGARFIGFWQIIIPIILPALAAFSMYLLVYSEPRHLGVFVVLLYVGLIAGMRIPTKLSLSGLAAAILLAYIATSGIGNAQSVVGAARGVVSGSSPTEEWQVVEGLQQMGFKGGLRIGSLNYSNHDHVRWARMARATIVAELFPGAFRPSEDEFWYADEREKSFIIDAFVQAGAQIIVSRRLPANINPPGNWQRIGSTRYYALVLRHG